MHRQRAIRAVIEHLEHRDLLAAQPIVYQPGPGDAKEIWTTSVYSYANDGNSYPGGGLEDDTLRVGGWADEYDSLLQFDLSNLPNRASSAILRLYDVGSNSGSPVGMYLDRIAQAWDWRTGGTGRDHDRLWWADRPATVPGDAVLATPTPGQSYDIDITDLYNAWQAGTLPNYGLELRPADNDNEFNIFYSSSFTGDSSLRPELILSQPEPSNAPVINSMSPSAVTGARKPQAVTVSGTGFARGDVVQLRDLSHGGVFNKPARFVSSTQLMVTADFTSEAANWTAQVIERHKAVSNVFSFRVISSQPPASPPPRTAAGWYQPLQSVAVTTPWLAGTAGEPSYLDGEVHLGADQHAPHGTPVYSIGAGTVIGVQGPDAGWGPNNFAVGILYQSPNAGPFVAIYGHIHTKLKKGQSVSAGEQIGTVGVLKVTGPEGGDHLHFGIHPGAGYPTASSKLHKGWGRESLALFESGDTNGFVDPLSWINTQTSGG